MNSDTLALLTIGRGSTSDLPSALSFYGQVAEYRYAKEEERELLHALGRHKRVLVAYYTQGSSPGNLICLLVRPAPFCDVWKNLLFHWLFLPIHIR